MFGFEPVRQPKVGCHEALGIGQSSNPVRIPMKPFGWLVGIYAGRAISSKPGFAYDVGKNNMSNSWMNNPNVLAQFGHAAVPYGTLLTLDKFHPHWVFPAAVGFMLWAVVKEFWYDANFETPKQSFMNNLTDFLFYGLGTGLGTYVHTLNR